MRRFVVVVSMLVLTIPVAVSVSRGEQTKPKVRPTHAAAEAPPEVKKDWLSKSIDDILTGPEELMRMTPENAPGYSPNK